MTHFLRRKSVAEISDLIKDTLPRDRMRKKPSTRRESSPWLLEFLLLRHALYRWATIAAHFVFKSVNKCELIDFGNTGDHKWQKILVFTSLKIQACKPFMWLTLVIARRFFLLGPGGKPGIFWFSFIFSRLSSALDLSATAPPLNYR